VIKQVRVWDGFLVSATDGRERGGLPFGQHRQEAAGGEHALDRIMDHVVGNDPLLRAGDGLVRKAIALDQEGIMFALAFGEGESHQVSWPQHCFSPR
jgi:hypothetical protein